MMHPTHRRAPVFTAGVFLTFFLFACSEPEAPQPVSATPALLTATPTATATVPPVRTPSPSPIPFVAPLWPAAFGVAPADAALATLRARDVDALLALMRWDTARCGVATSTEPSPPCSGVPSGTVVDYFPYFECDAWGSVDGARSRLTDDGTYALAVLAWDTPQRSFVARDAAITHTLVLVRGGFGKPDPMSDARLLTMLSFDGTALREIIGSCGAYSQAALTAGEIPREAYRGGAVVVWRAYP